jgi:hypothetical protein
MSALREPVPIHEHAIDNIRYIREAMERAGSFTAVPGWGGAVMGATALAAAFLAARQPNAESWLATWMAEAAVALLIGAVSLYVKARRIDSPLLSAPARKFALSFAPPLVAGALLTPVLYRSGLDRLIPGVWLMLYGTAIVSGGAFSVRVVPVMGVCFMALGTVALSVDPHWGDWFLASGFGGLQVAFGIYIAKRHGG